MTTQRRTTSHRGSIEVVGLATAFLAAVLLLASLPSMAHQQVGIGGPVPSAAPTPRPAAGL